MASSKPKVNIIHRETLQNANQLVEVLIRTKPKPSSKVVATSNPPKFVRDCALKKILDNGDNEEKPSKQKHKSSAKTKKQAPKIALEVSKKKRHRFSSDPNATWGDILRSCSTIADMSESSSLDSRSVCNMSENSSCANASIEGMSSKNKALLKKMEVTSASKDMSQDKNINFLNKNVHKAGNNLEQMNKLLQENLNTVTQKPHCDEADAKSDGGRLLSDGLGSTPFSDSALKLLKQIRMKLAKRGDSESSDALGMLEQYIAGGVRASPSFQSVFTPATEEQQHTDRYQQLLREFHEQQEVVSRQASTINELRVLSSKLLAQVEEDKVPTKPFQPCPTRESIHSAANPITTQSSSQATTQSHNHVSSQSSNPISTQSSNHALGRSPNPAPTQSSVGSEVCPDGPPQRQTATDREFRAGLLKTQLDVELLRRQVEAIQSSDAPHLAAHHNTRSAPVLQESEDSAYDETSRFTSKRPSPLDSAPSQQPASTQINTQSTQINTQMFATNANVPTLGPTLRNASTLPHFAANPHANPTVANSCGLSFSVNSSQRGFQAPRAPKHSLNGILDESSISDVCSDISLPRTSQENEVSDGSNRHYQQPFSISSSSISAGSVDSSSRSEGRGPLVTGRRLESTRMNEVTQSPPSEGHQFTQGASFTALQVEIDSNGFLN